MFVKSKLKPKRSIGKGGLLALLAALSLNAGVPAFASSGHSNDGTIPVSITIENVRAGDVPLYISVQKRGQYQGIKGHGVVLKSTTSGTMRAMVNVDVVDDYAVSLWHDLDNDGVFSMNERYQPEDGWGASGTVPTDRAPKFDDVKVTVPMAGKDVTVSMIYPN
ncbi:DUF2141 domain-containing protein [Fretibacter rubidus]|uniref:DUF2141 domain-containing protein n=1 Tax=Fretibacter rubidus TaxID=570162 RepID=UPI00352B705E